MPYFDHFIQPETTRLGHWLVGRVARAEFHLLRPYLPSHTCQILEVGPGTGTLADILSNAGWSNYKIIEPNTIMFQSLLARGYHGDQYLAPPFKEADTSVDVIIASNVFEHMNGALQASQFIEESHRILRPNGLLCLMAPDYLHWQADFFNADYTHNNITTARRVVQEFSNAGFRVELCTYLSGFVTGWPATICSNLTRLFMAPISSNGLDSKLYKLKLSLLRRYLIIGRKPEAG